MAPTGTRFEVEKFDGSGNFAMWQTRVKNLLAQQRVLKGLQEKKPDKMGDEDGEEMQLQAAATIRPCVLDEVMFHVMDLTKLKEI